MAYSYTQLPGDGSNQNFTFTFEYLSRAHISVRVNGAAVPFNWITDFSVQIIPAPAAGTIVEVRRVTPLDETIVDWSDGSVITESDMDLNSLFSLYTAQETQDTVDATVKFDVLGVWDGKGRATNNFADAVSPTGLITKQQLENSYKPDIDASVAAAAASATASANSATQSQLSATQSATSASDAAAILALFKGQYLGAQPTNPTVDGNGNPLTNGDLYFNTTVDEMRVYNGSAWIPVGSTVEGTLKRPPGCTPIIATAGQVSVPVVGGYDAHNIIVLVNGITASSPDVDVSSGTNLVFASPLLAGDEVDYYAFGLLAIANTFTKAELLGSGGAVNIGITPAGSITSTNVQGALNELDTNKAALAGNSALSFAVANATLPFHAVRLDQANSLYAGSRIQSVSATVASNALTVTLAPTTLDFRSSTLSSGVVNTRKIATALTIVVPSGATLGTVSAIASRLAILAIDNAGAVELAIVNTSGGINLDETAPVSTTAISASASAANVIYSGTARTNVPFRVVGFVESTQATAGTWAVGPTKVQGTGGQVLVSTPGLGSGQTWQVVTGSRTSGTTYYNTTSRPIFVLVLASAGVVVRVDGVTIAASISGVYASYFIVPSGSSYVVTTTFSTWSELR